MTALRLCLLGAGSAARTIALAAKHSGAGSVTAVWSPTASRRNQLASELGAVAASDPVTAMAGVDAVVVATPHATHAPLAAAALAAGRHVFCEKPFVTDAADGVALLDAAGERGLVLSVNHFQRYRRPNAAARQALVEGRIGVPVGGQSRLLETAMRRPWQHRADSIGFMLGYGVHAVDLLQWWLASPVTEVSARSIVEGGVERTTAASLRFDSGAVVSLFTADRTPAAASLQAGRAVFTTTLAGERGLLDVDSYDSAVLVGDRSRVLDRLPAWTDAASPERLDAYAQAFAQFAVSVRTGVPLELSAANALSAVRVCLAAGTSGRADGAPVCV